MKTGPIRPAYAAAMAPTRIVVHATKGHGFHAAG